MNSCCWLLSHNGRRADVWIIITPLLSRVHSHLLGRHCNKPSATRCERHQLQPSAFNQPSLPSDGAKSCSHQSGSPVEILRRLQPKKIPTLRPRRQSMTLRPRRQSTMSSTSNQDNAFRSLPQFDDPTHYPTPSLARPLSLLNTSVLTIPVPTMPVACRLCL